MRQFSVLVMILLMAFGIRAAELNILRNGLFNDKAGALAFWNVRDGGLGTIQVIPSQEEGASAVFRAEVKTSSASPWAMELNQRFDVGVPKNSLLYISFDYKITPGYSFNFYWQEERSPWPKLVSLHVDSAEGEWQRAQMAVPVHEELQPQLTAFSFHLAEAAGIFELRNVSATILPGDVDVRKLVTTVTPVMGGDFYDNDWRKSTTERMEAMRKTHLILRVVDDRQQPLASTKVELKQFSREVAFGVEASLPLVMPEALKEPECRELANGIEPYQEQLPRYKEMLLNERLFSFLTYTKGMGWREYASWGNQRVLPAVEEVRKAGLRVRGMPLFVPAYMFAPQNCRHQGKEELLQGILRHTEAIASSLEGHLSEWVLFYGIPDCTEMTEKIGQEALIEIAQTARKAAPSAKMIVSDSQGLTSLTTAKLEEFLQFVEWLKANDVSVDGVGFEVNMKRPDVAPQAMEKRLNLIYERLKLPMHITSLAVTGETPDQQATILGDYLLLFFSHPGIQSVSLEEMWEPVLLNPKMGLLTETLEPKPAYVKMAELLMQQWRTETTRQTDATGTMGLDLYRGQYEITLETPAGTKSFVFDTERGAKQSDACIVTRLKEGISLLIQIK